MITSENCYILLPIELENVISHQIQYPVTPTSYTKANMLARSFSGLLVTLHAHQSQKYKSTNQVVLLHVTAQLATHSCKKTNHSIEILKSID